MSQYCDNFFDLWETADGFNMYEDCEDEFQSWDGLRGPQGPKGDPGTGLTIAGMAETADELPDVASEYDVWLVGEDPPYTGYMYYDGDWIDIGEVGAGLVGPPGPEGPPEIPTTTISYQSGSSGTTIPSGSWSSSPVSADPAAYLWTRVVLTYSDNTTATYYSVAYQGSDASISPSSADPQMDGTAAPGSSASYARGDHVHPTDTSRAAAADHEYASYNSLADIGITSPATISDAWAALQPGSILITSASNFSSGQAPYYPTYGTLVMIRHKVSLDNALGVILFYGRTATESDHRMFLVSSSGSYVPTGTWIPIGQPSSITPQPLGTAAAGSSTDYSRADHVHKKPTPADIGAVSTSDLKINIYNTEADIGGSTSNNTITGSSGLWALLPNHSVLYTLSTHLAAGARPSSGTSGIVELFKRTGTVGWIYFHGQKESDSDWRMFLDSDGAPTGTWIEVPKGLNNLTVPVDLTGYNSSSTLYTFPSDGYVFLNNSSGQSAYAAFYGAEQTSAYIQIGNAPGRFSMFVRKGMKTYLNGTASTYRFVPLS